MTAKRRARSAAGPAGGAARHGRIPRPAAPLAAIIAAGPPAKALVGLADKRLTMAVVPDKSVSVIGLGYIGLPTAAVLASRGYHVRGIDISPAVVETINRGGTHIVEPELDLLVRAAVETGRLTATREPQPCDVFMICVPTPLRRDLTPDIDAVEAAARSICPVLAPGNLVILESTSPPGTTERLAEIIREHARVPAEQVHLAHAPERVLPGRILREVVENDRVIGGLTEAAGAACAEFYATFVSGEIHVTDARTAETVKLVENAFRDVNIAFANELSLMAEDLELDVWELIRLANRHPRVSILLPGPGVGGHCLAVDPWFLAHVAPGASSLIRAARAVNDRKPQWLLERITRRARRFVNPVIACLGLAYKPDIDDLRNSPALEIVRGLRDAMVGQLRVVEPNLARHSEFELCGLDQALEDADIVVFLVAHRPFKRIAPNRLAEKTIIDAAGVTRAQGGAGWRGDPGQGR
jgi:UDP-N-acetyl-D-mannosaminuronic acid dehydrogenase